MNVKSAVSALTLAMTVAAGMAPANADTSRFQARWLIAECADLDRSGCVATPPASAICYTFTRISGHVGGLPLSGTWVDNFLPPLNGSGTWYQLGDNVHFMGHYDPGTGLIALSYSGSIYDVATVNGSSFCYHDTSNTNPAASGTWRGRKVVNCPAPAPFPVEAGSTPRLRPLAPTAE